MSSAAVEAFGREVKRRRRALGMSILALGAAAGLTPNYVSDVEEAQRTRGISLGAAFRIASALGAELPELIGFGGLSGVGLEAARLVEALPGHLREAALTLLRALQSREERAS